MCKTETSHDLVARVFPRFGQIAYFYLEFSLALKCIFVFQWLAIVINLVFISWHSIEKRVKFSFSSGIWRFRPIAGSLSTSSPRPRRVVVETTMLILMRLTHRHRGELAVGRSFPKPYQLVLRTEIGIDDKDGKAHSSLVSCKLIGQFWVQNSCNRSRTVLEKFSSSKNWNTRTLISALIVFLISFCFHVWYSKIVLLFLCSWVMNNLQFRVWVWSIQILQRGKDSVLSHDDAIKRLLFSTTFSPTIWLRPVSGNTY